MTRLGSALLFALLASPALAAPKDHFKHQHLHRRNGYVASGAADRTGTGRPHGSGKVGPTGTGAGGPAIRSTATVNPLPVDSTAGCVPTIVTVTRTSTVTVGGISSANAAAAAPTAPSAGSSVPAVDGVKTKVAGVTGTGAAHPSNTTVSTGIPGMSSEQPRSSSGAGKNSKAAGALAPSTSAIVGAPSASPTSGSVAAPASSPSSSSIPVDAAPPSRSAAAIAPAPSSSAPVQAPPPASKAPVYLTPEYLAPASSSTSSAARAVATSAKVEPVVVAKDLSAHKEGRGLVGKLEKASSFVGSKCSWGYNWDAVPSGLPSTMEFVPMLWSNDADHTAHFHENAAAALASGSSAIMGFNEPDKPRSQGGSAIDPATAAKDYITHLHPFVGTARLGAPAVAAGSLSWMDDWIKACNDRGGCHYDFIPIHWYGDASGSGATQAGWMKDYIRTVRGHFPGAKIWLTEFSAIPIADQAVNEEFLQVILPWLDDVANGVERYSFFMLTEGNMIQGTTLTGIGKAYM